jgi:hypothetical protein
MAKSRKKNASNKSGGSWDNDAIIGDEGVDLSDAAEMWTEDELRELIREEALRLLAAQQGYPNVPSVYPQPVYPQWTHSSSGTYNTLYDGHSTVNCNSGGLVGAVN